MPKKLLDELVKFETPMIQLFFYKFAMEIIYFLFIEPNFRFMGMHININILNFVLSNVAMFAIAYLAPTDNKRVSTHIFTVLAVFTIIPVLSYSWLNDKSSIYLIMFTISVLLLELILKRKPFKPKLRLALPQKTYIIFFLLFVLLDIYLIIRRGGVDFRSLNFFKLYELRSEFVMSTIDAYLFNWSIKVFFPFFFTYYLFKRNFKLMGVAAFMQVLMFLAFGNKAILLSIGFALVIIVIAIGRNIRKEFILFFTGLTIFTGLVELFRITYILIYTLPFRMIFIPAQIQYYYYDFFSRRDMVHFADSIIGKIFGIVGPYKENYTYVIGDVFYGEGVNANSGIFADAYANGGFIAMIIVTLLFALVLLLIDSVTDRLPMFFILGAMSYLLFVLNDASLQTTLVTGGLTIMITMLYLFNNTFDEKASDKI